MKKPELKDYGLTEELRDFNEKQRDKYYEKLNEYRAIIREDSKKIKIGIIVISILITCVVIIINMARGFEDRVDFIVLCGCVTWDVMVVVHCILSLDEPLWKISDDKEREIAKLYRNQGYDAKVTSATADGGVDIILNKDGERIAVQCKHHAKPIGPNDVRALQGVVASQNYSKGIFVSLNGYTSTVYYEVRNGNVKIDLLDLKDILKMAKKDPYEPFDNPEKSFEKKEMQREPVLGEIVIHKIFGDGKIIKINPKENGEKYLTVDFTHSIKDFVFPSAFLMGFLMFQEDVDAGKYI